MFGTIKNNYYKSLGAVVAQNLLDLHQVPRVPGKAPAQLANELVQNVWQSTPHLFDGRFGQRPHKLSIAAAAFSFAISDVRIAHVYRLRYAMCLIELIKEFSTNGSRYPLNGIDDEIINGCIATMAEFSNTPAEFAARYDLDSGSDD